jgi:hypothetical protein
MDQKDPLDRLPPARYRGRDTFPSSRIGWALVAQRLEQGTHNPLVAGSNPAGRTHLSSCLLPGALTSARACCRAHSKRSIACSCVARVYLEKLLPADHP